MSKRERAFIGAKLRELRKAQRWSQTALAERLGLSQARLSDIERGRASLTAGELLDVLRAFNAPVSLFDPNAETEETRRNGSLQNALIRFGARHLRATDTLVQPAHEALERVVLDVLAYPEPRQVAAIAPVMVWQVDALNLTRLRRLAYDAGVDVRLAWALENTKRAVELTRTARWPKSWARRAARQASNIEGLLEGWQPAAADGTDVLDRHVRSSETRVALRTEGSAVSKRWNVVTALQVADFAKALEAAVEQ